MLATNEIIEIHRNHRSKYSTIHYETVQSKKRKLTVELRVNGYNVFQVWSGVKLYEGCSEDKAAKSFSDECERISKFNA